MKASGTRAKRLAPASAFTLELTTYLLPLPFPFDLDTQYKPDAVSTDSSADEGKGSTSSTAGIDRTTNMRLAEARLILNVKEDAPWDKVQAVSPPYTSP